RKVYLFAFLDDHSRLVTGYRFGYAEDTVRLAAALEPALSSRGVPASVYVDNGSAFVDAWLLRACAKLGIRLVHSTPHRPQGRGKIERFFRTVREQFLVEVSDTTAEELTAAGTDHVTALLELNRLLTAWIETEYHRRIHSETGQTPLERWDTGWSRLGRTPSRVTGNDLTEAFLWSEYRTVTKTATISLHGNTYQVDAALVGRKVELVFSPFDLETLEVRYHDKSHGKAVPHHITRHVHPKARPETSEPVSPPVTGIDYLTLTADTHHAQVSRERRIGFDALYGTRHPEPDHEPAAADDGQIPGRLGIGDIANEGHEGDEGRFG
ncbi:MAG: DDE-type integrase/transposase/recombinase, partial [Actinomycetes bacterium]